MTFAKRLFIAIDKLFYKSQNEKKMLKFADRNIIVNNDIVYDENDPKNCLLDTYHIEKKDGKYPVFFYIHGGGFVAGDKKFRVGLSKWTADKGFFVVNVNYALSPDFLFPTPIKNLLNALNWVGENAERLNLDTDNMIVSGDSAGGYYSALLASMALRKDLQDEVGVHTDLRFRGAVLDCGIYDVGAALKRNMPFDLTDKICFDFAGIHKQQFDAYEWKHICAPIDLVCEGFPASFVTYAEKDIFCKGQGPKLIEKLKGLGVHVEEYHSTKLTDNHCFPLSWTTKAAKENNERVEDFLKRFLAGEI